MMGCKFEEQNKWGHEYIFSPKIQMLDETLQHWTDPSSFSVMTLWTLILPSLALNVIANLTTHVLILCSYKHNIELWQKEEWQNAPHENVEQSPAICSWAWPRLYSDWLCLRVMLSHLQQPCSPGLSGDLVNEVVVYSNWLRLHILSKDYLCQRKKGKTRLLLLFPTCSL